MKFDSWWVTDRKVALVMTRSNAGPKTKVAPSKNYLAHGATYGARWGGRFPEIGNSKNRAGTIPRARSRKVASGRARSLDEDGFQNQTMI